MEYEPIYHHIIPHRGDQLGRVRLPTLRIEGLALLRCKFSSEELSVEQDENTVLARDLDLDEGVSSSSSNFILYDFSDNEEEGEKVN